MSGSGFAVARSQDYLSLPQLMESIVKIPREMRGKGSHFMSSQPKIRKNWSITWRHEGLLVVEHLWLGSCRGLHLRALPGQSFSLVFSASDAHCSYSSKSVESYTRDPRDPLISFCSSVSVSPAGPNSLSSHCPSLLPSFFGVLSLWTTYHQTTLPTSEGLSGWCPLGAEQLLSSSCFTGHCPNT